MGAGAMSDIELLAMFAAQRHAAATMCSPSRAAHHEAGSLPVAGLERGRLPPASKHRAHQGAATAGRDGGGASACSASKPAKRRCSPADLIAAYLHPYVQGLSVEKLGCCASTRSAG